MTIKELKEVIEFRYERTQKKFKLANDKNDLYMMKYYEGQLNMLDALKHDINLNMKADFLEAILNETN